MAEFYIANEYWFAVFQLVLAMLGMGATLELGDFREVVREPFAVFVGTAIQIVLVPLLAFVFIQSLGLSAGVAVGIALIAVIPGGTSSNIFTHFAKGNLALSISITAITTLACLLTTPLLLELLISSYLPATFSMPTLQIMQEITFNLLLPLLVGMSILRWAPKFAQHLSTWSIRGSVLGLLMIFIGATLAGRLDVAQFGLVNVALIVGFTTVIALAGWLTPRAFGLPLGDCTAIEMEVVVRSVNLGIMLKALIFPALDGPMATLGDMALFSLLLYGALQLLLGAILIPVKRSKQISTATA